MDKKVRLIPRIAPVLHRKKQVSAYARVSSGKDAMLHSLSAQVSYYSALIQSHVDWEYGGVFADEAFTGTKDTRENFQKLLEKCRAEEVDMIITKSVSRFARNTVILLETVRELKELGVDVFFEEQGIHTMTSDGELMMTLLAGFAQEESRAASENCKWRIRTSFAKGEVMNWRCQFGYRITKKGIAIHEEEAEVVRHVFEDYTQGVAVAEIARALRAESIPCPLGGTWTPQRIRIMLKNEKYTGNALLQKAFVADHLEKRKKKNCGELPQYYAEGTHPGIISQALFDKAAALREDNHQQNGGNFDTVKQHTLSSMITCTHCGKNFHRKMRRGKPAWICGTYLAFGKDACPSKYIPESTIIDKAAHALGLESLPKGKLRDHIKQIEVPANDRLVFVLLDGETIETEWQSRSRRESWTDEMKEQARAHTRRRYDHE